MGRVQKRRPDGARSPECLRGVGAATALGIFLTVGLAPLATSAPAHADLFEVDVLAVDSDGSLPDVLPELPGIPGLELGLDTPALDAQVGDVVTELPNIGAATDVVGLGMQVTPHSLPGDFSETIPGLAVASGSSPDTFDEYVRYFSELGMNSPQYIGWFNGLFNNMDKPDFITSCLATLHCFGSIAGGNVIDPSDPVTREALGQLLNFYQFEYQQYQHVPYYDSSLSAMLLKSVETLSSYLRFWGIDTDVVVVNPDSSGFDWLFGGGLQSDLDDLYRIMTVIWDYFMYGEPPNDLIVDASELRPLMEMLGVANDVDLGKMGTALTILDVPQTWHALEGHLSGIADGNMSDFVHGIILAPKFVFQIGAAITLPWPVASTAFGVISAGLGMFDTLVTKFFG